MKQKKCLLIAILAIVLLLSGCKTTTSSDTPLAEGKPPVVENKMKKAWNDAVFFQVESVVADHGEDGVIDWEDPGVETAVRLLLNKREGDILRSDVWDIQTLTISYNGGAARRKTADGWQEMSYQRVCRSWLTGKDTEGEQVPVPETLADLAWFDSLTQLTMNFAADGNYGVGEIFREGDYPLDIRGIEGCRYLEYLDLHHCTPKNLDALSGLTELKQLRLDNCGSLDLSVVENLPELSVVSVQGDNIGSLEPLTTLPKLSVLDISYGTTYQCLEPLKRTPIRFLAMSQNRVQDDDLDYHSLSDLKNLEYLDVLNNKKFDSAVCAEILSGCPNLKYLNITQTDAAKNWQLLGGERLEYYRY